MIKPWPLGWSYDMRMARWYTWTPTGGWKYIVEGGRYVPEEFKKRWRVAVYEAARSVVTGRGK